MQGMGIERIDGQLRGMEPRIDPLSEPFTKRAAALQMQFIPLNNLFS